MTKLFTHNGGIIAALLVTLVATSFNVDRVAAQTVSAGGNHTLSICPNRTVQAWGSNAYGELGSGSCGAHAFEIISRALGRQFQLNRKK